MKTKENKQFKKNITIEENHNQDDIGRDSNGHDHPAAKRLWKLMIPGVSTLLRESQLFGSPKRGRQ